MKALKFCIFALLTLLINSCASLKPVTCFGNTSLIGYKYAYITPTSGLSSSSGGVFGNAYGVYGSAVSKSINPSDVISGILMKNGFTLIPALNEELKDRTIIINYGESGRRNVLLGYTIEITLQIISADTLEVLCTTIAEGMGSTEADDIRIAITRAMEAIFPNK